MMRRAVRSRPATRHRSREREKERESSCLTLSLSPLTGSPLTVIHLILMGIPVSFNSSTVDHGTLNSSYEFEDVRVLYGTSYSYDLRMTVGRYHCQFS